MDRRTEVDWRVNEHNHLECGFFPFVDGYLSDFLIMNISKSVKIVVNRDDLKKRCIFEFHGVIRYDIEIYGVDVVADLSIYTSKKLPSLISDKKVNGDLDILYRNYRDGGRAQELSAVFDQNPSAYVAMFQGNMDGRWAIIFSDMNLFIENADF